MISMSPNPFINKKRAHTLTDSEDEEEQLMQNICSRTPMKPTPLDMRVKKDRLGLFMIGKDQLTEDLALASDSSDDLEQAASEIETDLIIVICFFFDF
jgi:hypothetical protein